VSQAELPSLLYLQPLTGCHIHVCSNDKALSRSELEQIDHNVVQTFINFVTQLDASNSLASTYLSRFEAYYAEQLGHRNPLKSETTDISRPYATYITWVVQKLEQEQNRCENLFANKTLKDGSVIEGKSEEIWALVHKSFQKEIVRESVLGMTQAGEGGSRSAPPEAGLTYLSPNTQS
jgi:hypothetical protein